MLRVTADDGATFEGRTYAAVVRAMRDADWNRPDRKHDYVTAVRARVKDIYGRAPRRRADHFIADLEALGLLRVEVSPDAAPPETVADVPTPPFSDEET